MIQWCCIYNGLLATGVRWLPPIVFFCTCPLHFKSLQAIDSCYTAENAIFRLNRFYQVPLCQFEAFLVSFGPRWRLYFSKSRHSMKLPNSRLQRLQTVRWVEFFERRRGCQIFVLDFFSGAADSVSAPQDLGSVGFFVQITPTPSLESHDVVWGNDGWGWAFYADFLCRFSRCPVIVTHCSGYRPAVPTLHKKMKTIYTQ